VIAARKYSRIKYSWVGAGDGEQSGLTLTSRWMTACRCMWCSAVKSE
jgi:hypothetical protein